MEGNDILTVEEKRHIIEEEENKQRNKTKIQCVHKVPSGI
jgi:hypothetical protein